MEKNNSGIKREFIISGVKHRLFCLMCYEHVFLLKLLLDIISLPKDNINLEYVELAHPLTRIHSLMT